MNENLDYKEGIENNCLYCLLKSNCKLHSIVRNNSDVFKLALGLESINVYSESDCDIGKFCKLFVKDDIKELSLPNIDIIEKRG